MKMIRTMLVDDERLSRLRLRRMLENEPDLDVVAECADGEEAVKFARQHQPDLLFLDIDLPGKDGFGVLEDLGDQQPSQVVFVTAYDEHAVRAFDACALDYLVKPITPERVTKAIARARAQLASQPSFNHAIPPGTPPPLESGGKIPKTRFVVRSGGRVSFVAAADIDWIEAAGNYAIFHVGKQNHMVRDTMSRLESQLAAENHLRVSRSAILNLRRVKELYNSPSGDHAAILADGQRVPFTRSPREVADRLSAL